MSNPSVKSAILTTLKKETAVAHKATEAVALGHKMKDLTLSRAEYSQLISCNWWIHQRIEKTIDAFLTQQTFPKLSVFFDRKSEWLAADMAYLNIIPNQQPFSTIVYPKITTKAALLGCLYVIEGSMLGGQLMVNLFRKHATLNDIAQFHFYQGYGKNTRQRWKTFQALTNEMEWTPLTTQQAVQQAKDTFRFFQSTYQIGLSV